MKIDFKELIENYNTNLTDKLRGFGDEEYLKFYVPDSEKYKSLINLIDALFESGVFKVKVDNIQINYDERIKLQSYLKIAIKEISKNSVDIDINPENYKKFKKKKKKIIPSKHVKNYGFVEILDELPTDEKIDKFYLEASKKIHFKKKTIGKDLFNNSNYEMYEMKFSSGDIFIYFIDINKHQVIEAICKNEKNSDISNILYLLSELIINKNIQEVAEHIVIYLEYELRKLSDEESKNKGIFLPANAGGLFNLINKNFRNHYNHHLKKFNIKENINKEYYEVSSEWKNKNIIEKENFINDIIDKFILKRFNIGKEDLKLNRIIQNNRLEFVLSPNLKGDFGENILFRIEDIFKNKIDNSIELFSIEEKDSNKLRLTKAPKSV